MSDSILTLPEIGEVKITRKKGMRSIRMRITAKGEVVVSAPKLTPGYIIKNFIDSRASWILENRPPSRPHFQSGQYFGAGTKLIIDKGLNRNRSFITKDLLRVSLSEEYSQTNTAQNDFIEKKILKVMTTQSENTLLPRLQELADATGHTFNQAHIKTLVSRWGSCDQDKNIILNVYLLQVPPKLQDYVMLHELTHTIHMHHGKEFWDHMAQLMPSYKLFRKMLKDHQTAIVLKNIKDS